MQIASLWNFAFSHTLVVFKWVLSLFPLCESEAPPSFGLRVTPSKRFVPPRTSLSCLTKDLEILDPYDWCFTLSACTVHPCDCWGKLLLWRLARYLSPLPPARREERRTWTQSARIQNHDQASTQIHWNAPKAITLARVPEGDLARESANHDAVPRSGC